MGGLEHNARDRVVDAAAYAGDFAARGVDDLFLCERQIRQIII